MMTVANKPILLSVIMLNVVRLIVMAPSRTCVKNSRYKSPHLEEKTVSTKLNCFDSKILDWTFHFKTWFSAIYTEEK